MSFSHVPPPRFSESPGAGEKDRGGCLTVWLIVITASNVFFGLISAVQLLEQAGDPRVTRVVPAVLIYGLIALQIALIAGLFGIWRWKRWGVFTVAGTLVVSALFYLAIGELVRGLVVPLIHLAFMYYVINLRWNYFE